MFLTNSVNPDQAALQEQSDLGLHCLPLCLHLLDGWFYGKPLNLYYDYGKFILCRRSYDYNGTSVVREVRGIWS